eukprot:359094-Chlamydomonas_euryale.AAC.31
MPSGDLCVASGLPGGEGSTPEAAHQKQHTRSSTPEAAHQKLQAADLGDALRGPGRAQREARQRVKLLCRMRQQRVR